MASTYNQYALASNAGFKSRCEMTLLRHAMYVKALPEPAQAELDLANRILGISGSIPGGSSSQFAERFARIVAQEPSLSDKVRNDVSGAEVTDADLLSAVATHFLSLA